MLEKMKEFFAARAKGYDYHMLNTVEGCEEGYKVMASLLPKDLNNLLDLGCGTGLELQEIFKVHPNLKVTGIDLTAEMLEILKSKFPDKEIVTINESYFDYDFGTNTYDVVISFQTMHHFSHKKKVELYTKIHVALKTGGQYIEGDYMVSSQHEEDYYFTQNDQIRKEQGISEDEFYHYDTPCTVANQLKMFLLAGFSESKEVWREENTSIVVSKK